MDNLNISNSFDINIEMLYIISQGNPGCINILLQILKSEDLDSKSVMLFFDKIYEKHIFGSRLLYIYINECNRDIKELISKDFIPFNDDYFYEKFEKFEQLYSK